MSALRAGLTPLRDADAKFIGDWYELGQHAVDPNPFAHPHFVLPAGDHLAGGRNCAILHVYDGADVVFALPVVRRRRYRRVPVRTIATWAHPYCFLGSPLTADGRSVEAWEAALQLLRARTHADLLALELLPQDGVGLEAVELAMGGAPGPVYPFDTHIRPVIHRRPDPDYFETTMSAKHRKNLRRQRRHLDQALRGQLRRVDWGGDYRARPAAAELFLNLELAGWKGRAGTAMACSDGDARFFRQVVNRFGADGQVQMWFFEASGTPVAGQCNFICGDSVFHFKIAYDEDLRGYSPGVLLELEMIAEFHEDPQLNHIDSCAAPGSMYESLYPDRRMITHALVPMHRAARPFAAALAGLLRRRRAGVHGAAVAQASGE